MSYKVFLAPDVLIAFLNRNDPKHLQASAFFRYFAQEHDYLYTSSDVILSVYKDIEKTISASFAKELLRVLPESTLVVLPEDEKDMKKAVETVANSSSTEINLPDTLMLSIAERNRIPFVATFRYMHKLFGREIFYLPV